MGHRDWDLRRISLLKWESEQRRSLPRSFCLFAVVLDEEIPSLGSVLLHCFLSVSFSPVGMRSAFQSSFCPVEAGGGHAGGPGLCPRTGPQALARLSSRQLGVGASFHWCCGVLPGLIPSSFPGSGEAPCPQPLQPTLPRVRLQTQNVFLFVSVLLSRIQVGFAFSWELVWDTPRLGLGSCPSPSPSLFGRRDLVVPGSCLSSTTQGPLRVLRLSVPPESLVHGLWLLS